MTAAFRFKQFSIRQTRAAMKVGFDGILLGAWANCTNCRRALDIGTGTGLVALMLAQRTATADDKVHIDAIEIDEDAMLDAIENVRNSPWSARVNLTHASFQDWYAGMQKSSGDVETAYDLITCNPPFFKHAAKQMGGSRERARHDVSLSTDEILSAASELLSTDGSCCLIVPIGRRQDVEMTCSALHLFVVRRVLVRSLPNKRPHRVLLEIRRHAHDIAEEELTIESEHHIYTDEFRKLCKDFYLAF